MSNTGSPRFTDFPSLCACSESSLTNLIGSGLNLLCLQSHSKPECRWTRPEVAILGADQKERGLWGREWDITVLVLVFTFVLIAKNVNLCFIQVTPYTRQVCYKIYLPRPIHVANYLLYNLMPLLLTFQFLIVS